MAASSVDVLSYRYVDVSRLVVKQTNFNWGTLNIFNIIETLQNCFTFELLLLLLLLHTLFSERVQYKLGAAVHDVCSTRHHST